MSRDISMDVREPERKNKRKGGREYINKSSNWLGDRRV